MAGADTKKKRQLPGILTRVLAVLLIALLMEGSMRVLLYAKAHWLDSDLPDCIAYTTGRCRPPEQSPTYQSCAEFVASSN